MIKLQAILNAETGTILGVLRPDVRGQAVPKRNLSGLAPHMIPVEVTEDSYGTVTLVGKQAEIIKEHNWNRIQVLREGEICQAVSLHGVVYCVDAKSFEAMKDLEASLEPEQKTKWKVMSGERKVVTKEQLQEVIKEYVSRRQDSMEAA